MTLDEAPVSLCFRSKVWDRKHPTNRTNVIDFYLSKARQLVYLPILLNTCLLVIYENVWQALIYLLLLWVLSSYSRSFKDPSPGQAFRLASPRCIHVHASCSGWLAPRCVHVHASTPGWLVIGVRVQTSSPGILAIGVFAYTPAVQAGWPQVCSHASQQLIQWLSMSLFRISRIGLTNSRKHYHVLCVKLTYQDIIFCIITKSICKIFLPFTMGVSPCLMIFNV